MTEIDRSSSETENEKNNPYRKPFLVLILIICLSLLSQQFGTYLVWNMAHDTNVIVKDVNFRNSPATQEKQKELLDLVILKVDCNSRHAIQDALNEITRSDPRILGNLNIVGTNCDVIDKGAP